MYLLGNESNYGLHWTSFEIQALPQDERHRAMAVHLYSLYGEITDGIHEIDPDHPVSTVNGDLQYLDLIAEHMPNVDILGTNVYRGISARDLYEEVDRTLGIPVMYTEFGADAYDAKAQREDHLVQARYHHGQWEEIYAQSAGNGRVGNAIGGFVFQWADGWWKYLQEENLDVHDTNASWPNGGYVEDFVEGRNNMNEEWFGICAKGPPDPDGRFELFPRASYYVLRDAWRLDPYADATDAAAIDDHFATIDPAAYDQAYRSTLAVGQAAALSKVRVRNLRMDFDTVTTGDTARSDDGMVFDHLESFYGDFEVNPVDGVTGHVELNVLGHVPTNPIDDLFYEARAREIRVLDEEGEPLDLSAAERVKVYKAGFDIDTDHFRLQGFYREGHFHWGYEGDTFGLYPEAYYGPAIDWYNADAPIGVEMSGKQAFEPFKVAFGPQVYWGANPTVIAKAYQTFGNLSLAVVHQEDFAEQAQISSSAVIPERPTRRTAVFVGLQRGSLNVEGTGLISGMEKMGESFDYLAFAGRGEGYAGSRFHVLDDQIQWQDALGGKLRFEFQQGRLNWYGQGMAKGLVANSGVDPRQQFAGWSVREAGRGNQLHASTGVMVPLGNVSVAPQVVWQQPLIDPNTPIADQYDPDTGWYYPPVLARNILDDPFAVLDNRETTALELLLTWDPTPGSWMWAWDNDLREDALLAGSLDLVYKIQYTTRDANLGFTEAGDLFAFPGAPPAADVWEVGLRLVSAPRGDLRFIGNGRVATEQARGDDDRMVRYGGGDLTVHAGPISLLGGAWVGAYGPYDYHRDYNLTYPFQTNAELAWRLGPPRFETQPTRFGSRFKYRQRDEFSPEFASGAEGDTGAEWEWSTFVEVSL